MVIMEILVHDRGPLQFFRRQVIQRLFQIPLPCVLVMNTVGLVLQNTGAKTTKLILNTLLYGVFHFLTSLRSREGGWSFSSLSLG